MSPGNASLAWQGEAMSPTDLDASVARQGAERAHRRRQQWLHESKLVALGYGINGGFLAAYAWMGTVHWSAAVLFAVPGWVASAVACALISSGRSRLWRDPGLSDAQSLNGMLLCGIGVVFHPAMTFLYVLNLFTIFLGATYRMPRHRIHLAWFVMSALIGMATLTGDRVLQIPHATVAEQVVAWTAFSAILSRCVLLSVINTAHNHLLRRRGQQMADTLAQIERLANFDELTGLPNRRNVLRTLDEELARSRRDGTPLSVALFDIDHFKAVNDTHGHLLGDQTLRAFAQAVSAHRRTTDTFGRHGGEEFLLVLPATLPDEACQAVDRLRAGVSGTPWHHLSPGLRVTFSAGLVSARPSESAEHLLARADLALYGAKHAGRDCLRIG